MKGLFRLIKAATREAREMAVYETPSWSGSDVQGVNRRSGFGRAPAAPDISSAVWSETSRPKGRWLLQGPTAILGKQGGRSQTRRRSQKRASRSRERGRGEGRLTRSRRGDPGGNLGGEHEGNVAWAGFPPPKPVRSWTVILRRIDSASLA